MTSNRTTSSSLDTERDKLLSSSHLGRNSYGGATSDSNIFVAVPNTDMIGMDDTISHQNELSTTVNHPMSDDMHLKTYTAGEDGSRLAEMARELGLKQKRKPRQQIRARVSTPLSSLTGFYYERLLDRSFADVRMRSVFTSHSEKMIDEEGKKLMGRLPSWREDDIEVLMEEAAIDMDSHAHGLGGDMVSAVLGIIKGMVGPAILYLPHGFANAGLMASIPILVIAAVLFLCSSACLLESWKLESLKDRNDSVVLLGERGKRKRIILSYPELAYRAFGSIGETIVKVGIALMQSGVCLTYLIFIPLSWIRDIRKLAMTNLVANVLILYGLITCLCFAFATATRSTDGRSSLEEIRYKFDSLSDFNSGWFLFIGTSVLLFEGSITLLVPLQEAVYREEDRERFPAVYKRVIASIITFYTFFGISCWMAFGNNVRTTMTTSLPEGILATTVQLAYSVAVIFTFPLQNFPSLEIACQSISTGFETCCGKSLSFFQKRNVIASSLVCLLAIIAVFNMENLDRVVSLMGSMIGCPLAFVFPPLIHNKLHLNLPTSRKISNHIVASLGLCAMVLASITTLLTW